eukprot:82245-Lingulodinium_polyedra.AAC.1
MEQLPPDDRDRGGPSAATARLCQGAWVVGGDLEADGDGGELAGLWGDGGRGTREVPEAQGGPARRGRLGGDEKSAAVDGRVLGCLGARGFPEPLPAHFPGLVERGR